ncbi:MAG: AzlC family ABC transporter permease [Acidimicrobiales bacterium]
MTDDRPPSDRPSDLAVRRAIVRQVVSISLAVAPFGVAFGVVADDAGLTPAETAGFSTLVFSGSAQFAAVTVLGEGGTVAAAVVAALLLNLRSVAFGIVMAPALRGPLWWRALVSQLVIDESTAVGSAQGDPRWRRAGFLAAGIGIFVVWNLATLVGYLALSGADDLIDRAGIDATIPAAFLALVWPRLLERRQRLIAGLGAAIALLTTPLLPPGLPTILAATAVVALRPWRGGRPAFGSG